MKRTSSILITAIVLVVGITAAALVFRATQHTPATDDAAAAGSVKAQSDTSQQNGQQADPTTDPSAEAAGIAVDPASAPADSVAIALTDQGYNPGAVSVVRGTTIVWTNTGAEDHTITGKGTDGPRSGELAPGKQYAYMFTKIGTYSYSSRGDTKAQGIITVTE